MYKISTKVRESIIAAGPEKHAMLRKALAPGFSEKSMREQEPIISKYVSLLIERLAEMADKEEAVNMVDWCVTLMAFYFYSCILSVAL